MSAAAWAERYRSASAHALYVHIPFCVRKCAYCDFASFATPAGDPCMTRYAQTIATQIRELSDAGLLDLVETAYIGGGTPSMLGPSLAPVLEAVSEAAGESSGFAEFSCEANPESVDAAFLDLLSERGVSRLSMGVQSLDDAELEVLGRIHSAEQAERAVKLAVSKAAGGVLSVSVDLMCGIPLQSAASWRRTLERVVGLGVEHVSVYPLIIEEGTVFSERIERGEMPEPDDDLQAELMLEAERILGAAGMPRYEVASYAEPGRSCLHNRMYWSGRPYIGLGSSGASMLTREAYALLRGIAPQLPEPASSTFRVRLRTESGRMELAEGLRIRDLSFEVEELTEREALAEDLMLSARLSSGVPRELVELASELFGRARMDGLRDSLLERGLVRLSDTGDLAPTREGWLRGNELYGAFWDLASEG